MEAGVDRYETQSRPAVRIRDTFETFFDAPSTRSQETVGDRCITNVDQEEVDEWLRGAHHVLLRCNELNNRMVEVRSQCPIRRSLQRCVPIKGLGYVICQIAHVATPAVPMIKECHEGINVGSATATTRDNLIWDHWDLVFRIMERSIWLDDKSERQLGFLEERVSGGNSVER